ncbi:MAG: hypothetical protein BGO39_20655 [Chloroflexi bacterium 54-19]|nr:MAG: hypothetical protein BGO39_20655 [Chloroflexi bacterium 54-19]
MKLRLAYLLAPIFLTLSLLLSACGVGDATSTPFVEQPAATVAPAPTATVTAPAAQKQPAAVPAKPAQSKEYLPAYGCLPAITVTDVVVQACMDKPEPTQYETLQITTRMSKDGLPIAGAPIKTTWDYKTTRAECTTTSDSQGLGFCYRNIGAATLGFRVVVEVQYDYNGQGYRGETSFTTAHAGVAPTAVPAPPTPTPLPPVVKTAAPKQAPAPAGVQFTSVQGGRPGAYASVTVQTAPGASCSISYTTPHGTDSTAAGLVNKNANGAGVASWSWKIGTNTYTGTGEVDVTCNGNSASASITIG